MIGNILSWMRNSPVKMPILLLALLLVPPKLTGASARADEAQHQMNADVLRTVFDLVLAPLQQVVQEGTVMDCADGKTRLCFPILSVWIADHAEHTALHGIGSKSCPKCEVPCKNLGGNPLKMYETRDYIPYREKALRHEPAEVTSIAEYFQQVGVKIGNNVFAGLDRVNPADLHKPDLLHNIYLGLVKHMMEGGRGSCKSINGSRLSTMPGKKLRLIPDSAYQKRPIVKLHNGRERKSATSTAVFGPYWRPHCKIWTVLSITISRAL